MVKEAQIVWGPTTVPGAQNCLRDPRLSEKLKIVLVSKWRKIFQWAQNDPRGPNWPKGSKLPRDLKMSEGTKIVRGPKLSEGAKMILGAENCPRGSK